MTPIREGGCQCGAVRYRVEGEPIAVVICHCTECQRQSGSAFGMSFAVRKSAFQLLRGNLKRFTRKADSSRSVACAFCPECGTRIYHELGSLEGTLSLKPGTLDDTSFLRPTTELWATRRQPWIRLPPDLRSFRTTTYVKRNFELGHHPGREGNGDAPGGGRDWGLARPAHAKLYRSGRARPNFGCGPNSNGEGTK